MVISNATPGLVVADGVRLVKVEPVLPNLRLLTLEDNPLDNRAHEYFIPALESRVVEDVLQAAQAAPADGQVDADIDIGLDLITGDGRHTQVEFELPAVQTSSNDSLADLAADLQAAQQRQHQVQDDKVGQERLRLAQPLLAVVGDDGLVALALEVVRQHLGEGPFVLDDEDARLGHGRE